MANTQRIQPYERNPAYWQYRGKPVLLLGGSDEDNLFQLPPSAEAAAASGRVGDDITFDEQVMNERMNLAYQLDTLAEIGGNLLRCTMSSRDVGDAWPYAKSEDGRFDLDTFNDEFWTRFERFLRMTHEREIIVQIEMWATYDFYEREVRPGFFPWQVHPFNPKNNVNYTSEESGLPETLGSVGFEKINPFFETVPALSDNGFLLDYQRAYVDKLLSISFEYDNVLYCVDNETNAHPAWAAYWARYLRDKADQAGVEIEVSEMWDTFDPTNGAVEGAKIQDTETHIYVRRSTPLNCLERPDLYSFSDISNHNAQRGETHYRTGLWFRNRVQASDRVWPVHCVKMYGGDVYYDFSGTRKDGLERFWRNVFAGLAGCRFHRPPAGIGLDAEAQTHLRAMRMLTDALDVFTCQPRPDLLSEREENSAYCLADAGRAYAVAFVNPGSCRLDVSAMDAGTVRVRWLDIEGLQWREAESGPASDSLELRTPESEGYWAVLVDQG